MATLKDIAQEAGVSVMTVSRVVNKQYSKVSKENIEKIEAIIKKHGYVPNLSARSLSSRTSKIVVLIVRGGEEENVLKNIYNAEMVGGISKHLQNKGYSPMLYSVSDYQDVAMRLHTWNADGALFFGSFHHEVEKIQKENNIPLVFTDSYSKVRQITNVGLDDYKGGALAAKHFIDNGHKNMAFLSYGMDYEGVVRYRFKGFSETLEQYGITVPEEWVFNDMDYSGRIEKIFASGKRPTAVFATADILAIEFIKHLNNLGYTVPGDCSVIGFDNMYFSNLFSPSLTTINQDIEQKSQTVVDILCRHMENPDLPAENVILDVSLIKRDSVKSI